MSNRPSAGTRTNVFWYVAKKLPCLDDPVLRRTVMRRWRFYERAINTCRAKCPDQPVRILDAGCGEGLNLKYLATAPGVSVFACDHDQGRADQARKQFPSVQVSRQDILSPDYETGFFDIILCSHVIELIPDDMAVLSVFRRLLAPGGALILGVPNEGCLAARMRNGLLDPQSSHEAGYVHHYTRRKLEKKFRKAGFRVHKVLRENFYYPMRWMNDFMAARKLGFYYMQTLNFFFRSQAAGYHFLLRPAGDRGGR
jgi:SAM-dependent methyltransferase